MYVITKVKNIKRIGQVYNEEIEETHYKRSKKIIISPRMVLIKYREFDKVNCSEKEVAQVISIKDLIEIEVLE